MIKSYVGITNVALVIYIIFWLKRLGRVVFINIFDKKLTKHKKQLDIYLMFMYN